MFEYYLNIDSGIYILVINIFVLDVNGIENWWLMLNCIKL